MHYGAYTRLSLLGITLLITTQISGCFSSSGITGAAFSKLPDPNISMDSLPPVLRGEYEYKVSFQVNVAERLTINSVVVELSQDGGSTYSPIANLSGNSSVFPWKTPKLDAGNLKLRMTAYDNRSNNTSTESRVFEIMSTPPSFGVNQPKQVLNKDRTFELDGKCDNRWPIHLSTVVSDGLGKIISGNTQVLNCSDGKWSVPGGLKTSTDGIMSYNLNQTDAAGNTSMSAGTWTSDTTAPSDVKLSVVTNPGDRTVQGTDQKVTSSINYIPLSISAADPLAGIRDFCLKYATTSNPSSPANDDSCWIRSNRGDLLFGPGSNPNQLSIAKYTQRIGFTPGSYSIYVWLRDNAGNISQASSSGSSVAVDYYPKLPPQIANLMASLSQTSTSLLSSSGRPDPSAFTTTQGPVYIRWQNIETDRHNPLDSNPISLYYTTDDVTYTKVPGAQGLSKNYVGGGCQIDSQYHNGCFAWSGSLPTGYFRVRLTVRDINGQVSASSTNPINSGSLLILAGNTDPGSGDLNGEPDENWGTSGTSSMFFNDLSRADTSDVGSLVVLEDGTIFFKDKNRGILTVNPRDGVQKIFLRLARSGVAADQDAKRGDGKQVSQAWLKSPGKITLDWSPEGGLLIFDYDRIRRVDLKTLTIDTLIGSATPLASEPDDTSEPILANQVVFTPVAKNSLHPLNQMPLVALPNGDIYFQSSNYQGIASRIRVYHQGKVSSILPVGNTPAKYPKNDGTLSSSKYMKTDGTLLAWDYFGPLDQVIPDADTRVTDHNYHITSYRMTFGYDSSGDSKITEMQAGVYHLHPGNQHILYTSLNLTGHSPEKSFQAALSEVAMIPSGFYDALTYSHTGRNGKMYIYNRGGARIYQYEAASSSSAYPSLKWIAGTGVLGACDDVDNAGAPVVATQCPIDIQDVYVTASGDIYFVDRGRIRTVTDTGTVVTLYGQGYSYGDGKLASAARFNQVNTIDQVVKNNTTEIVASDAQEARIRSFKIGDLIQTVVGNGINGRSNSTLPVSDFSQSLPVTGWGNFFDSFVTDSATGDIYLVANDRGTIRIARINRSNNPDRWENLIGGGSKYYSTADGFVGSQISFAQPGQIAAYYPTVLGIANSQLLTTHHIFSYDQNMHLAGFLKLYDLTQNATQIHLAGSATKAVSNYCANGTSLSQSNPDGCTVPSSFSTSNSRASFMPASDLNPNAAWLVAQIGTNQIRALPVEGNMATLATTAKAVASFVYREIPASGATAGKRMVYYCGTNGLLYSRTIPATGTGVETNLPLPVSTITCSGRSMLFNSSRKSLIFPIRQNGMSAIAEYLLNE